tara:strand:+ start:174 stop:479 length:306 start_codon:yes stop_codon:yes gene_type:complete
MKKLFENWNMFVNESAEADSIARDSGAGAFDKYYDIKQAVKQKIEKEGGDWAINDPDYGWESISVPTSENDAELFFDTIATFAETYMGMSREDLGLPPEKS